MVDPNPTARPVLAMRPTVLLEEPRPVDFRGALLYLLARRWQIVIVALFCGVLGAVYSLLATPWYRSEVVMVAAEQSSPLSGLGNIGGLASLAGLNLGGKGSEESLAALHSRSFTADFINSRNLIPVLFADDWDEQRGDWKNPDPQKHPDIRKAVEFFQSKVRTISEDSRASTVTVGVQWKDAGQAAEWANDLATQINARMRKRALDDAERNVKYLQEEIASSNVVALQQSIGRVLESEMQKLMMARGTEEYAFKIVDHATPARKRYRPQRVLTVILSLLAGGLLTMGYLLVRRSWAAGEPERDARE